MVDISVLDNKDIPVNDKYLKFILQYLDDM
jgi:hypothetical protein